MRWGAGDVEMCPRFGGVLEMCGVLVKKCGVLGMFCVLGMWCDAGVHCAGDVPPDTPDNSTDRVRSLLSHNTTHHLITL